MGYFQLHHILCRVALYLPVKLHIGIILKYGTRRFDRSWGVFFESFEEFLTFSWPTITVTDTWTGRAHIVVRMSTVGAFLKMLKTSRVDFFRRSTE